MRFNDLSEVPADWPASVVTVGVFDGVHLGHRALIDTCREAAQRSGNPVVAVTFDPHPNAVVRPESAPDMLSSVELRVELLHAAGADAVLVLSFTVAMSRWPPERFATEVLAGPVHARTVVVGENFRFGNRAAGNVETLRELGQRLGFSVLPVTLTGDTEATWSSSFVRDRVAAGDVTCAAAVLGRPHRIEGTVVHGDHRGRELGYPTANLDPAGSAAVPADGVYAGWLIRQSNVDQERLAAAISIGTNPTFDGTNRRIEAYVLDRSDLDLYGELVAFEFVERIRSTLRFDSVDELVEQMSTDVDRTRVLLAPA